MSKAVDDDEARAAFIERKLSNWQFASEYGVSLRTAERTRDRIGRKKEQSATRAQTGWETRAKLLLDGGASYGEVSRTLDVSRTTLTRKFPGMGWTSEQGGEYKVLKDKFDKSLERWGL